MRKKTKKEIIKKIVKYVYDEGLFGISNTSFILNVFRDCGHIFKDEMFSYESEIRYVISAMHNDKVLKKEKKGVYKKIESYFYASSNTIRPCIQFNFEEKLPIKKIIVSPFNSNETVINGIKEFLEYSDYGEVIVELMKTNARFSNH